MENKENLTPENSLNKSDDVVIPEPVRKTVTPPILSFPVKAQGSDSGPSLSPSSLLASSPVSLPISGRLTGSYIRPIQRRGNTYMIRDSLPLEDDPVEADSTERMIEDLCNETLKMSAAAQWKATLFKVIYVLTQVLTVVGGVVVTVLSFQGYETTITKYSAGVIGAIIAGVQSLMMLFAVEKRGVLLKDVSIKLRKISRQVRALRSADMKPNKKIKRLEEYYAEVDDLDLSIFDNSVTTTPVEKATNISKVFTKRPGDLDSDSDDPESSSVPGTLKSSDAPIKKKTLSFPARKDKKVKPPTRSSTLKQPGDSIIIDMKEANDAGV